MRDRKLAKWRLVIIFWRIGRLRHRLAFKEFRRCRLNLRGIRGGHLKMCLMVRGDDVKGVRVGRKFVQG